MGVTWTNYYDKDYKDPYGKPITCAEWYDTHDSAKPHRDRVMQALHRLRFKSLWQEIVDNLEDYNYRLPDLYKFVNSVRTIAGMPKMTKKMYDEGRIYRHIFAGDYKYCLEEMWLLCWGDW